MRKLFWLPIAAAAIPLAGVVYQKLSERSDRRRYGNNGRLVRVGSKTIYVNDARHAREDSGPHPTILFESGIGATSQNWLQLQSAIASEYRAVSYDRAGLGWSSGQVTSATPKVLARELHDLLKMAGIAGPYVVVAHSFGGLVARQFAADYPGEVLGLLLVDPMRPEDWPPLGNLGMASVTQGIRLARAGRVAAQVGLSRLFMRSTLLGSRRVAGFLCRIGGEPAQNLMDRMLCEAGKMPRESWPAVVANWSRPGFYRTLEAYLRSIPEAVTEMHAAAPIDLPVTVLTPISATPLTQEQIRSISSKAIQVFAPASAHWIHLDEPELVLREFHRLLSVCAQRLASPTT
ncbi:MAG TPA: alpha/beta hydrolase [Acidobacteriaceae bacterium]|nr:alpha/beta hydrolase [Acidobacteriaceae bacterium]